MFHLRAFVSERLSAAAVDIFGEVEKSLSLYQVEVSRSREEIILLRQQLELLRDNNTGPLQATGGTMLDHAYIPPVLQENSQGPPGTPEVPVDEEEEPQDYSVRREFLPGPSEKTEHDVWKSSTMTQPNPEIPQIKEEQDGFSIEVEVCPTPDVVKSEPDDQDGAEMEFKDRTMAPPDGESSEEWLMGDERRHSSTKNRKLKSDPEIPRIKEEQDQFSIKVEVCPSPDVVKSEPDDRDGEEMEFTHRTLASHDGDSDEQWVTGNKRRHSSDENRKSKPKEKKYKAKRQRLCAENENVAKGLSDGNEQAGVTKTSPFEEDSTLNCHFCGKSFRYMFALLKHIKKHRNTESKCGVCGKTCASAEELSSHLNYAHRSKCDVCGRTFSKRSALVVHAKTHTGVREHVCNFCGRSFRYTSALINHIKTHDDNKDSTSRASCHFCGKSFQNIGSLVEHIKLHNISSCEVCGKSCVSMKELLSHLNGSHSKSHFCNVCGRTFSERRFLIFHTRTHTGMGIQKRQGLGEHSYCL